jgi:hypothetical protein
LTFSRPRAAAWPPPATIDAALEAAYKSAAIYFPFSDVIVADPYKDMVDDGLDLAFYIGQSQVVGGTTTDMLRAVYLDDPVQLRHQLEISNWQLAIGS